MDIAMPDSLIFLVAMAGIESTTGATEFIVLSSLLEGSGKSA